MHLSIGHFQVKKPTINTDIQLKHLFKEMHDPLQNFATGLRVTQFTAWLLFNQAEKLPSVRQ